jgi:hemolysin activation/secretion protein
MKRLDEEEALKMGRMAENAEKVAKGQLTGKLVSIRLHGSAEHAELASRLPIQIGDTVDAESIRRMAETLRTIDRGLHVGVEINPAGEISLHVFREESDRDAKKP